MMKIETLRTLSTLTTDAAILDELNAAIELAEKENARKANARAARMEEYEAAHDAVMAVLADSPAPVTLAELFDALRGAVPETFTKGKLSYALRSLWGDEIVKTEGKVNTYAAKA